MSKYLYADATTSVCGTYRYDLERRWRRNCENAPFILWVLLNPSTADAYRDDPTVRKAAGFSQLWGYARMVFVNLFAYRSTDPRALVYASRDNSTRIARDVVGPENNAFIEKRINELSVLVTHSPTGGMNTPVVVAWGRNPIKGSERHNEVLDMLLKVTPEVWCLGINQDGHPKHPLMLAYDTPLQAYSQV